MRNRYPHGAGLPGNAPPMNPTKFVREIGTPGERYRPAQQE